MLTDPYCPPPYCPPGGGGLYDLNVSNSRTLSLGRVDTSGGAGYRNERTKGSGTSMEDRAVRMLAEEVRRKHPTQTGVITDGPPYKVGPVKERRVLIDPQHPSRGWRDVTLEELRWQGPADQKIIISHYHDRSGRYGQPTEKHDFEMLQQGQMYFTNPELASRHRYQVLQLGRRPEERQDPRIILPSD